LAVRNGFVADMLTVVVVRNGFVGLEELRGLVANGFSAGTGFVANGLLNGLAVVEL